MTHHLAAVLVLCACAVLVVWLGAAVYGMATMRAGVVTCYDGERFEVWATGAGLLDENGDAVTLGACCAVSWK